MIGMILILFAIVGVIIIIPGLVYGYKHHRTCFNVICGLWGFTIILILLAEYC